MQTKNSRKPTLIALLFGAVAAAQGPLAPPTATDPAAGPAPALVGGVPQPSMKTLHQVEPRIPVNADNTPGDAGSAFIISNAGSYYLTGPLGSISQVTVKITATDVTLDLNGYQLIDFGGSSAGIEIGPDADRCTIRNGTIRDYSYGINRILNGDDEAAGGSFETVAVSGHSLIALNAGRGWTVTGCRVQGGGNSGIVAGEGSVVSRCTVHGMDAIDGTNGIQVRNGSTVVDCSVTACDVLYGIRLGEGSTAENCTVSGNTSTAGLGFSYGILADSRCVLRGCNASLTTSNASGQEEGAGISAEFSCQVIDCLANKNDGAGIIVAQASLVKNCKAHLNGEGGVGAGIWVRDYNAGAGGFNELIGNSCTFNVSGIEIDNPTNLVIQNRVSGNGSNFTVVADNRVGTVVVPAASGALSGFGTTAAGVGTTDPWANFSY